MPINIGCIVEGHGEVESVRILVERIVRTLEPGLAVAIPHPIRTPRSKLVKPGEIERAVELAARKIEARGGILVLLDSDSDCPAQLAPELLSRARAARDDLPIAVVLAKQEFEAWFLAAAESLRGVRGLPVDLMPPADPEEIRGAKEWLSRQMSAGPYRATLHQPAFTGSFDLAAARQAPSFDKCFRDVAWLLQAVSDQPVEGSCP